MKLHILSDLHIEFGDMKTPGTDADIVILAGDTHVGRKGINWAKNKFKDKPVLYIIGNHEYYHGVIPDLTDEILNASNGTNVHVLENDKFIMDDVVFLGCTLWTDFNLYGTAKLAAKHATAYINDFQYIKTMPGRYPLKAADVLSFHEHSLNWLKNEVEKYKDKKIVVVTHNGPSLKSCSMEYKDDILTAYFVSNLEEFIKGSNISVWVHGHIHNSAHYMLGDTEIVCNPRGYCTRDFCGNENLEFDDSLIINI